MIGFRGTSWGESREVEGKEERGELPKAGGEKKIRN